MTHFHFKLPDNTHYAELLEPNTDTGHTCSLSTSDKAKQSIHGPFVKKAEKHCFATD